MKPVVCKYRTTTINSKEYITGWQMIVLQKRPDLMDVKKPTREMNEIGGLQDEYGNWKYVLVGGTSPQIDLQTATEKQREIKVEREIVRLLPGIMRTLANDPGKGFDDLKAEIKAIDDSITIEAVP